MKNLNFCEILKGHEGETFYNPTFGNMKLNAIYGKFIKFMSIDRSVALTINSNGTFCSSGEVCIFPSKDQCDWNKWIEEQKPKVPKTWSEMKHCNVEVWQHISNMDYEPTEPIVKSALALLKIHQLIEVGYGGNVIKTSDNNTICIIYDVNTSTFMINVCSSLWRSHIMFHTREQAEEFLEYIDNIQLLKDYFMI